MSGLNVAEWTPDQVADWLSGLGPSVAQYVPVLKARGLDGKRLLMLRCDDLEYLGMHVIGHQELLLEAVEHLRNFQYELSRECIQQLAMRVCVLGTGVSRALRGHADVRLDTGTLADVARAVSAVKPLVVWLDRWAAGAGAAPPGLGARRAALLRLALEAATSAQRDRFAEQPARAVAAAAAAAALAAAHLARELPDPAVLQPATLDSVTLRQAGRPLGFDAVPSFCGRHQLADVRFGSPAHASGAVHEGDEIVAVGGRCVVGWAGGAVRAACAAAARGGELSLRLRRRAARPPLVRAPPPRPHPPDSDSDSGPLSPPASPSQLAPARPRIFPPKPPALVQRRHTISCGSPVSKRPSHTVEQFWQQLRAAGLGAAEETGWAARDRAASSGRLAGGATPAPGGAAPAPDAEPRPRLCLAHRLDKSHSTPAYDAAPPAPDSPPPQPAAPSAEKAEQILEFKKSSSQIEEALQQRRAPDAPPGGELVQAVNRAVSSARRRSLLSPPADDGPASMSSAVGAAGGARRPAPRSPAPPPHPPHPPPPPHPQVSIPLRHIMKRDILVVGEAARRALPALNSPPAPPAPAPGGAARAPSPLSPSAVRGMFPTAKSRSLKKKTSILAKRRSLGARAALAAGGAGGGVWQRVRGAGGPARWAPRVLVLLHSALLAYRRPDAPRAALLVLLGGCTVAAADEVRSRAHSFKVYHTGSAVYFACHSRDDMLAWIQMLHRATLLPPPSEAEGVKQFSETEYSDSETDDERAARAERRWPAPHASTSLDRKYLRFFSRSKHKDEPKPKSKSSASAASAEEYRSFRREATSTPALHHIDLMPQLATHRDKLSVRGVTLEQFMLQQTDGRTPAHAHTPSHSHSQQIVPDVIYGEVGSADGKDKGKDGYEKIVFPAPDARPASPPDGPAGLRRNDRVHSRASRANHSWSAAGGADSPGAGGAGVVGGAVGAGDAGGAVSAGGAGGAVGAGAAGGPGVSKLRLIFGEQRQAAKYPHLVCPPTFQPETYSLRPRAPRH